MSLKTSEAIEIYRQFCQYPTLSSARLSNDQIAGHVQVRSSWSQRDLERKEKLSFTRAHVVQLDNIFSTFPSEINEQWNVQSESGKYRVVIRKKKEKGDEDKQYIEIWSASNKLRTMCVADLEQHGQIYDADGHIGSVAWNNAETHLLYIAEKKVPKSKSYFEKASISAEKETETEVGNEYAWKDVWGEQMTEKRQSVLCVLDIESAVVSILENLPEDVCAAQAIWSPDDMGVICVGLYQDPYKLGLVYCPIRKSALFFIDLKSSTCSSLTSDTKAVRSPVFSIDKTKLLFLENDIGGAHQQCSRLKMIDWPTKGVVEVVERVQKACGSAFPGIYTSQLNRRCWLSDNRRIVMHTMWRSKQELVVVDTETGNVQRLTEDADVGSWTLMDVRNDIIVAACSSPNCPDYLVIGHVVISKDGVSVEWKALDERTPMNDVSWRIVQCDVPAEHKNPKYDHLDYECILLEPVKSDGNLPLVAFPHGGPHSVIPACFALSTAVLCRLGYAVLLINYRGSIGFGQDSIESLLGNIGTQDVHDCQDAVKHVLKQPNMDADRVVVTGGSHGGFLTAHLIGQFPSVYKGAALFNPGINIASMINSTDIPDWCHAESGLAFDPKVTSSADIYRKVWDMSPISHVDQVKTPTLILLGAVDLRVPPKQGEEFYKALKARSVPTRLLVYPKNNHPINAVDAEADAFINMVAWFSKYLGVE